MHKTYSLKSILMPWRCGKILVARHVDDEVRMNSSSGGAFFAIAKFVLEQGGYVIGAAFNGTEVEHIAIRNITDLGKLQKSKYAPSSLSKINMSELLGYGVPILFSGTPCQVKGMAKRYGRYSNLFLLEVACHGVPTINAYRQFISENNIVRVDFRCKKEGWKSNIIEMVHSDGSITYEHNSENNYMQGFLRGDLLRKKCFECNAKYFSSGADFTLSDAWGISDFAPKLDDNIGSSLIFVHTHKANSIWNEIHNDFIFKRICLIDAIRYNASIVRPINSEPILCEKFAGIYSFYNVIKNKLIGK